MCDRLGVWQIFVIQLWADKDCRVGEPARWRGAFVKPRFGFIRPGLGLIRPGYPGLGLSDQGWGQTSHVRTSILPLHFLGKNYNNSFVWSSKSDEKIISLSYQPPGQSWEVWNMQVVQKSNGWWFCKMVAVRRLLGCEWGGVGESTLLRLW